MKFAIFLIREGSSILFAALIFAFSFVPVAQEQWPGALFIVTLVCLSYLSFQMALAAFTRVGNDKPLIDFFFSMFPMFALIIITVLALTGTGVFATLDTLHIYGFIVAGVITMMDIIFNTQTVFKINRLATDFVQQN